MLSRMATGNDKRPGKVGRIMIARYLNTVGEPRSEILHAPHLFLFAAIYTDIHFIIKKEIYNLYGYACLWILKLHKFLSFST